MKFIKYVSVVVIAFIFSCKSTYNNRGIKQFENNPFKVLDSVEQINRATNFTINPVEDWELRGETGSKYYKPSSLDEQDQILSLTIYKNIVKEDFKRQASIEDYLDYHIQMKKRWYPKEFKYKLLKANHKLYGEVYVVNFIHRYNLNSQVENSLFLIVHKNNGYTLEYKAKSEEFYKRLSEVEKMVNSFRVLD
ncbi:hypothetical protein ACOSP6_04620 [Tenacibaculum sp. MEBiC06402]|uniref:hypothetical protein n=1 Tax=unclassified Tenacibaculum TaxID=2635139 RepID=UPI003B9D5A44